MKRILFVDDEPYVRAGLMRLLYPLRHQWEMAFAGSGREALRRLEEAPFDVLVTDLRMPEMTGVDLLGIVRQRFPGITRIVLSGVADLEHTLRANALAHQYLCKPCDAVTLRSTLERARSMQQILEDAALRKLIAGIEKLPRAPTIYLEINAVLGLGESSAKDIADVLTRDIAVTAKLLQLVNSPLFGLHRRITSVVEAVTYLGIGTVKSLALSGAAFSEFRDPRLARFAEQLSEHGLKVAALAREIANSSTLAGVTRDDCFAAGILHDIGKLILVDNRPAEFQECLRTACVRGLTSLEAEAQAFGVTHAEVGAYLLWLWGLPDCVTEAAAMHHRPGPSATGAVLAVHAADALIHNRNCPELDTEALGLAGLMGQVPHWQQIMSGSFIQRQDR
ncbi:MAG TPA: response regulator [Bryobacteraceae bacterium]|nr:response regulator [Bryobacteraceae bacterium]